MGLSVVPFACLSRALPGASCIITLLHHFGNPMDNNAESIALFFKSGSSDKEYHVHLMPRDSGWIVEIQYGKRGSALKSALKTKEPVDFALAKKTYDKIVAGQLKDGYTQNGTGAAYQSAEFEARFTGIVPQLLNPVAEEAFGLYLDDDEHMLQEKLDGQRLLMSRSEATVIGVNRDGLQIAIPLSFEKTILSLPCSQCVVDNEWLGDRFAPFDLLELDGKDLRSLSAEERKIKLDDLMAHADPAIVIHVETAKTPAEKRALHDHVKTHNGEGVVAKRKDAPYTPGRPNSLGPQLKRKFIESATLFVTAQHKTKRSVAFSGLDANGSEQPLGNVTIPANHEIPSVGDIVEIQYLYAHKDGSLYQPVFKGKRNDQHKEACVLSQLKYKSEGPAALQPRKAKM